MCYRDEELGEYIYFLVELGIVGVSYYDFLFIKVELLFLFGYDEDEDLKVFWEFR